jgi:uncharacterized protein
VTNSSNSDPDFETLTRTQILVLMGVTALILMAIAQVWQRLGKIQILKITFDSNAFLWGIGLAIIISVASSLIYRLWESYRRSADFYLSLIVKPLIWADLIWLGLLPGLSEELLFRGVMLSALGANFLALIISSIIFGILHYNGTGQTSYIVWATVVGLMLGYSALLTGNLLVPIIAHIITNWVSSITWKLKHPETSPNE